MAGFFGKKTKTESPTKSPTKVAESVTNSTSPPPLFARFATTTANKNVAPRIVSSPMMLTSQRKDRDLPQRMASGRGFGQSTTSLNAGGRDMNPSQRKMPDGHQAPSSPINVSGQDSNLNSAQQLAKSPPRPTSRAIVDKPLPPPSAAIINEYRTGASSDVVNRRATLNKGPGPPTSFQPSQPHVPRPRASLDMRDLENKPLPRPGSAQASYPSVQDTRGPPPSNYKLPPMVTPKRNTSVSSANAAMGPQIGPPITSHNHKILPPGFHYGQQNPPTTDAKIPSQTLSPQLSQRPVIVDDFPKDRVNGIGGIASKRMSSVGPSRNGPQGIPMSDRGLDLPPEFALFQEYRDAISIPDTPSANDARRLPAESIKPTGQAPPSSIPGSGVHWGSEKKPQPTIPQPAFNKPHPQSPPLPPPPPPDMGITASHAMGSDVLSKNFRSPHMMGPMDGPASLYNSVIVNARPQYQSPNGRSTSPPLPPGAAPPGNLPPFPRKISNVGPMRPHNQHPHQPPQGHYPSPQPHHQPNPPPPTAVMLQKTPSMQAASAPLRGKPRIFAAMEAQESDGVPSTQNTLQSQQYAPQPQPPQAQAVGPNRPPANQHNSREHQQQSPPPLLPPVEFTSPRLQSALLPNDFFNEVDPRSTPASITPPSLNAPISDHGGRYPDLIVPQESDPTAPVPKSNRAPSLHRQDEPVQQLQSPQATPRVKKLSKTRTHVENSSIGSNNGNVQSSPEQSRNRNNRSASKSNPSTPMMTNKPLQFAESTVQIEQEPLGDVGIPLDDDPFARMEGVKMLKPTTPTPAEDLGKGPLKGSSGSSDNAIEPVVNNEERKGSPGALPLAKPVPSNIVTPLTPESPEKTIKSKKDRKGVKATDAPPTVVDSIVAAMRPSTEPATMAQILSDPQVLSCLLSYFTFYDWCILSAISKEIRVLLVRTPDLRETVLETYLRTIGYCRWAWEEREPLSLSLQDLNDYMRGVSVPSHEYARVAAMHVHSLSIHPNHRDPSLGETVRALTGCTRAYSRVLLRLRAQAEKEASLQSLQALNQPQPPPSSASSKSTSFPSRGYTSRVSSRAPSPTTSNNSHTYNGPVHGPASIQPTSSQTSLTFRSPLFRLRRAPLLRVFIPSPEGDWLSDKSVLECEAECKRAGIMHLLRLGDVIWDVAVGDEGNVGRLVWDGSYLIDLDYTYSTVGDLPKYLPTLAFAPSYFHRVIRTGSNASNPVIHMDISPWGEEIAMNLQLLQDRVRTETPQGAYHNVVRWVHRSSFSIRPPRGPNRYNKGPPLNGRIPIPDSANLFVDSGWYGTIVVETEGTNEALADLQDRCGPGAFPPRHRGLNGQVSQAQIENRKVFRILREKSRPGEIWIKAVSVKERLL